MKVTYDDKHFNFPCQFPIKCIGKHKKIEQVVCQIISKHIGVIHPNQIKLKASSKGKYLAVTVSILATNKAQLDVIYTELNNHPEVLYSL